MSDAYELVDRLVAYARIHLPAADVADIEDAYSVGEFDLAVDAFLVSVDERHVPVNTGLLAEIEDYSASPTPSTFIDQWRQRIDRLRQLPLAG